MVVVRYSGRARGALALVSSGSAAMRCALARITSDGTAIDRLRLLLRVEALPDSTGIGEV